MANVHEMSFINCMTSTQQLFNNTAEKVLHLFNKPTRVLIINSSEKKNILKRENSVHDSDEIKQQQATPTRFSFERHARVKNCAMGR